MDHGGVVARVHSLRRAWQGGSREWSSVVTTLPPRGGASALTGRRFWRSRNGYLVSDQNSNDYTGLHNQRQEDRTRARRSQIGSAKDYTSHKLALESAVTRSRGMDVDVGVAGGA